MDKQKEMLVEGLVKLACAQADILLKENGGDSEEEEGALLPEVTIQDLNESFQTLQKWVDSSDDKVSLGDAFYTRWKKFRHLLKLPNVNLE